jgi:hypothetical protein
MRYLVLLALLSGCAMSEPAPRVFAVEGTNACDTAWLFWPSKEQSVNFQRHGL